MNVDEYLRRIKCAHLYNSIKNYETLTQLQLSHLLHIPFENIDIHLRRHIDLRIEDLYDKIIKNKRGGYCLELNPLFAWLLQTLGYKCYFVSCYYFNRKSKDFHKIPFHIGIIVEVNKRKYYVDICLIDLRQPLLLIANQIQHDKFKTYKFVPDTVDSNILILQQQQTYDETVEWTPCLKFKLNEKYELKHFTDMNEYVQKPDSDANLHDHVICVQYTHSGLIKLVDWQFIEIIYDENKREIRNEKFINDKEFSRLLGKYFGIQIEGFS